MKQNAFTLVELLVVIAIVVLVVAIVTPSLVIARSYARATICRSNLHQLGTAFAVVKVNRPEGGQPNMIFPTWGAWPSAAYNAVPCQKIFMCPECDVVTEGGDRDMTSGLEYRLLTPESTIIVPLSEAGPSKYVNSRRGSDAKGSYTEYVVQDEGNAHFNDLHDGLFRIYDSGTIWIIGRVPDEPGYPERRIATFSGGADEQNCIYLDGRPAFGTNGCLYDYRDQKFQLGLHGNALTNYGLNMYAYVYPVGAQVIVLTDFDRVVANPDYSTELKVGLMAGARHLGKLNVLSGDNAVRTFAPDELNPRVNKNWNPAGYKEPWNPKPKP